MLEKIIDALKKKTAPNSASVSPEVKRLAAAALLVEAARRANDFAADERAAITRVVGENFKLSAEAINLTNEAQFQYVDSANLQYVYHKTGREYLLGIRFNY